MWRLSVLFRAEPCCPDRGAFQKQVWGEGGGTLSVLCHGGITGCLPTVGRGDSTLAVGLIDATYSRGGGERQPACRLPPQRITSLLVNVYFGEREACGLLSGSLQLPQFSK